MTGLFCFIFGYVRAHVNEDERARAVNLFLKNGISLKINSQGFFYIPLFSLRKIKALLLPLDIEYGEPSGLLGRLTALKTRYGIILALLLTGALYILTAGLVFDIRVSESSDVDAGEVVSALADAGFFVGARFPDNTEDIERRVLLSSDKLSFININRRGSVAYIEARGKSVAPEGVPQAGYEIVAKYDAVIEAVEVKRGIARVSVGQTVRAGDVLISGIIPDELGGGSITPAGSVTGRVAVTEQIHLSRTDTVCEYADEALYQGKINILGKEINIFKKYRNSPGKYDIISLKSTPIYLFGVKLPISVGQMYVSRGTLRSVEYTDSELIRLAEVECARARARITALGEVVGMSCDTELGKGGISVRLDAVYLTELCATGE
ncbi:MAG: sporulation protein YqfD [Clostridia bacterium]|nr:sporulation protein YqfD [Clostridia bacterium]